VGVRPLACWERGFESHRGDRCLSLVNVVCCQVRWADHSSKGVLPTVVCLECDREASLIKSPGPTKGCCATKIKKKDRGPQIFQKSTTHLKILDARRVTCSKFHSADPQILDATIQNYASNKCRGRRENKAATFGPHILFRML